VELQLLMEAHLRGTKGHLPYGITELYLPNDTGEHACLIQG